MRRDAELLKGLYSLNKNKFLNNKSLRGFHQSLVSVSFNCVKELHKSEDIEPHQTGFLIPEIFTIIKSGLTFLYWRRFS